MATSVAVAVAVAVAVHKVHSKQRADAATLVLHTSELRAYNEATHSCKVVSHGQSYCLRLWCWAVCVPAGRVGSLLGALPCCTARDSSSNGELLEGTMVLPDAMATLCGGSSAGMPAAAGAGAWGWLDWLGR